MLTPKNVQRAFPSAYTDWSKAAVVIGYNSPIRCQRSTNLSVDSVIKSKQQLKECVVLFRDVTYTVPSSHIYVQILKFCLSSQWLNKIPSHCDGIGIIHNPIYLSNVCFWNDTLRCKLQSLPKVLGKPIN